MNENKIYLDGNDIVKAMSFAKQTQENHHNPNNRSSDQIIDNIFVGKLGEISYYKLFSNTLKNDVHWDSNKFLSDDYGYDFIDNENNKIDIKTLDADYKQKVYVKPLLMRSDIYCLMQLDRSENFATYIGKCTKNEILENLIYDERYHAFFVNKELFKE